MFSEKPQQEKQFHESITVQGLSQVFDGNSNHFRRILWLLILCGGIAFTTFNIYNQVTLYLSEPVSIRVDQLLARRLPFPTITICNKNFMMQSTVEGTEIEAVVPLFLPYTDFEENVTQVDLNTVNFDPIFSPSDPLEIWEKVTHSPNNTVIRCEWESGPCGLDNFTRVATDTNLCMAFNVDGTLMAKSSGRVHGFRALFNIQLEEYMRSLGGDISAGLMIAIHSSNVPVMTYEMGISVAAGFQHFFGVEVKSQSAKDGISGCGTRTLNFTANYTREACRLECRGKYLIEKCGCKDVTVPNVAPLCNPVQYQGCLIPTLDEYLQKGTGCEEDCPEPCSFTSFITQHSNAPLSPKYITAYTKYKGQTEEYWRKNLVVLEVYLTSMTYQNTVKRLSYEILDLFCDIGGALGLLLGASILTMVEIFDFLFVKTLSGLFVKDVVRKIAIKPSHNR